MRKTQREKGLIGKRMPEGKKFFLVSIPFVIFVFAFAYIPLFGWAYAFFDYRPGLSLLDCDFVGFKIFAKILNNKNELIRVMRNTLAMSFIGLLGMPLPVIFAIMLNEIQNSKFRKLVQTTTTLPNFISWIVVFTLAFAMFSSDGLVTNICKALGMDVRNNLLGDNKHVWIFQWALGTWKSLGWGAIIYVASIAGIDAELYDAAHVDGANRWQTIRHITIPGLYPTFFVQMLLQISNMLNNGFEQYFVFYNPLVANKIEVLDYYVFSIGVLTNDYPQSIALGMCKTIISVTLLFTANRLSKKVRGESIV